MPFEDWLLLTSGATYNVSRCRWSLSSIQCHLYSIPGTQLHATAFAWRLLLIAHAQHTERMESVESMVLIRLAAVDHVWLVNTK